jgi:hypothetical protein
VFLGSSDPGLVNVSELAQLRTATEEGDSKAALRLLHLLKVGLGHKE